MIPSTGSATWDTVGQIAIACLVLVSLVMMWRRRR
jgi:LPXTG-motif cell wall-anchored protein